MEAYSEVGCKGLIALASDRCVGVGLINIPVIVILRYMYLVELERDQKSDMFFFSFFFLLRCMKSLMPCTSSTSNKYLDITNFILQLSVFKLPEKMIVVTLEFTMLSPSMYIVGG